MLVEHTSNFLFRYERLKFCLHHFCVVTRVFLTLLLGCPHPLLTNHVCPTYFTGVDSLVRNMSPPRCCCHLKSSRRSSMPCPTTTTPTSAQTGPAGGSADALPPTHHNHQSPNTVPETRIELGTHLETLGEEKYGQACMCMHACVRVCMCVCECV